MSLASFDASWRAVLACEVPSCKETTGLSYEVLHRPGKAGETFRLCRAHKAEAEKEGLLRRSSLVRIRTHKEIQPMPASCLVPGCTNKITGRGLCATHYARANAARMFKTNQERPPFTAEELAQLAATPVQARGAAPDRPAAVAVGQRQDAATVAQKGAEQQPAPPPMRAKLAERLGLPSTTMLDTVLQSAISALATQEHMITEARQRLDEVTTREGRLRHELEQFSARAGDPVAPTIGQAGSLQRQLAERLGLPPTTMSETVSKAAMEAMEALTARVEQLTGWADDEVRVSASALGQIAAALGVESGDPEAIEAAATKTRRELAEAEARADHLAARVAASGGDADANAAQMRAVGRIAGYLDCDDSLQAIEAAAKGLVGGLVHMTRCYERGERRYVNEGTEAIPVLAELVTVLDGYRDRCVDSARRAAFTAAVEAQASQVQATPWLPWEPLDEFLRGSRLALLVRRVDGVYHFEAGGKVSGGVNMATLAVTHPVLDEGLAHFLRAGTATFVPLGER